MLNVRPVIYILGWIACAMAAVLCLPAATDAYFGNPEWEAFLLSALISVFLGGASILATQTNEPQEIDIRQAFLVTTLGWVVVAVVAALPFLYVDIHFANAIFESVSAITTTGSTVFPDLAHLPPGILLWRGILQWIGGIGIIAVAILILPLLRVGGMQLFKIESSDTSEEKLFTALRTVVSVMSIYAGLTILCGILYSAFGMSTFDAIIHAMTTLSTGGFSTHDESFVYFKDFRLHWTGTVFMIAGALPFILYIKSLRGHVSAMITDQQVRGFIGFLCITSVLMALWLMEKKDIGFLEALTLTSFNITSVVTTTGFASDDYTAWGPGAVGVFLVLMFVGGCSGSTSGAIKIYRHQILFEIVRVQSEPGHSIALQRAETARRRAVLGARVSRRFRRHNRDLHGAADAHGSGYRYRVFGEPDGDHQRWPWAWADRRSSRKLFITSGCSKVAALFCNAGRAARGPGPARRLRSGFLAPVSDGASLPPPWPPRAPPSVRPTENTDWPTGTMRWLRG